MSLSSDFYDYLSTAAGVVSAVGYKRGASGPAKVWPSGQVPEGTAFPYVSYSRTPDVYDSSYGSGATYTTCTWRIECYADTRVSALTISDAVRAAIDHARGTMGSTTVLHAFVRTASDEDTDSGDGSELSDHMVPLEVEMAYLRTVSLPTLT